MRSRICRNTISRAPKRRSLREWGWEIVRVLDAPLDFLELGSGSAVKTRLLDREALRVQRTLRYSPIDISTRGARASSLALVEAYPALSIRAYAGDYFDVLGSHAIALGAQDARRCSWDRTSATTSRKKRRVLLALLGGALRPGDGLLLGTDLKKDRATLELAYDDPAGVTAAFDRNVLARINRELGGDFELRNFDHVVRYDEERGCVDSFLEARERVSVPVRALGLRMTFEAGERIHTESSYKFTDQQVVGIGRAAGFRPEARWHDDRQRFSVHLLVRE